MKKLLYGFLLSGTILIASVCDAKNGWKKKKRLIFKGAALIAATCVSGVAAWYGVNALKNFWAQRKTSAKPVGEDNDTVPEPNPGGKAADSQQNQIPSPSNERGQEYLPHFNRGKIRHRHIHRVAGIKVWDSDWLNRSY